MPLVAISGDAYIAVGMGSQFFLCSMHVKLVLQQEGGLLKWHRQFKKLL